MTSTAQASVLFFLVKYITAYNIPITPVRHIGYTQITPQYLNLFSPLVNPQVSQTKCYNNNMNNKWDICQSANSRNLINALPNEGFVRKTQLRPRNAMYNKFTNGNGINTLTTSQPIIQYGLRRMFLPQIGSFNLLSIHPNIRDKSSRPSKHFQPSANKNIISSNSLISAIDNSYLYYPDIRSGEPPIKPAHIELSKTSTVSPIPLKTVTSNENMYSDVIRGLDQLERKFYANLESEKEDIPLVIEIENNKYMLRNVRAAESSTLIIFSKNITFDKLTEISPTNRKENGISFVQSGLFLLLGLIALSSEVDYYSRQEIEKCINIQLSESNKLSEVTNNILASLPPSTENLKFRWSTRLILWPNHTVTNEFKTGPASALQMHIDLFNGTESPEKMAEILNDMVEIDSGGSIRNTFEEDDLSEGAQAILLTTLYLRGRWRSAPTLLNGSRLFRDTEDSPSRTLRCIRINDVVQYADLTEWDAEAIEIFYATPGLSLLMLVPRGSSLRRLADHVATTSIHYITQRMHSIRIGVTMPLYTLRMTLLLPNKLQAMGISRLVDRNNTMPNSLTLSHAVQRLMFWAEAGHNAFKDDGIEWDETPELELVVDRPYIFFVRWRNLTLMNGNFVL